MIKEVFNRYEKKYLVDNATAKQLMEKLAERIALDTYNQSLGGAAYPIQNLYYDSENDALIRHSLSKPDYKEKVRIRSYEQPTLDSTVFVEIKKKVRGLVNKRRFRLPLRQAYAMIATGGKLPAEIERELPMLGRQVLEELRVLLAAKALQPKVALCYDRIAFADGEDLRISFDANVRSRRYSPGPECGSAGTPLLPAGMQILEVKVAESMPLWVARLLSEHQVRPTSFSKYGTEFLNRRQA